MPLLYARTHDRSRAATAAAMILDIASSYVTGALIGSLLLRTRNAIGGKERGQAPTEAP